MDGSKGREGMCWRIHQRKQDSPGDPVGTDLVIQIFFTTKMGPRYVVKWENADFEPRFGSGGVLLVARGVLWTSFVVRV